MKLKLSSQHVNCVVDKIVYLFKTRPFIFEKKSNYIKIEFYKTSSQDLKKNCLTISLSFISFLGFLCVFLKLILWLSHSNLGEVKAIQFFYINSIFYAFLASFMSLMIYTFYITLSRIIFLKNSIKLTEKELLLQEKIYGYNCKTITIPKANLPSLILHQNNKNNLLLLTYKTSLIIKYKHKNINFAEHLAPQITEQLQQIYETYRTCDFETFYNKTINFSF